MASLNQDWRDFWLRSPLRAFEGLSEEWWYVRLVIWGFYFLAVAGGSVLLLRWRSYVTCIYNLNPEILDQSLAESLDRLQLSWKRSRNRVYIGISEFPPGQAVEEVGVSAHQQSRAEGQAFKIGDREIASSVVDSGSSIHDPEIPRPVQGVADSHKPQAVLEIDSFPAMHHVTLHWQDGGSPIRNDVEAVLAKVLEHVETTYNPAFTWLMSVATVLLSAVSFGLLMVILFAIFVFYGSEIAR